MGSVSGIDIATLSALPCTAETVVSPPVDRAIVSVIATVVLGADVHCCCCCLRCEQCSGSWMVVSVEDPDDDVPPPLDELRRVKEIGRFSVTSASARQFSL